MALVQAGLRGLAEGALMAALCVVLGLSAYYIPVLGVAAVLVGPVPIVVACLRHGPRIAILAAVVAGILLGAFLGAMQGLVMGFGFGSMGLALGMGFSRQAPPFTTVLWGSLAVASASTLSLGLGFLFLHISPVQTIEQMFQAYESASELWGRLGAAGMQEQARTMVAMMRQSFALLWPAAFAGAFVMAAAINWAVARAILRRLGYRVPDPAPFAQWRVPRWLLIPFLLAWAAMAAASYYRLDWLYRLGTNVNMLLMLVMAVEGAAVAFGFLRRWFGGRAGLVLAGIVIMIPGLAWPLIVWLGVFDLLFDYRRLANPAPGRG
ncbi:MAG: YybS family protein [Bacillota bacterium]